MKYQVGDKVRITDNKSCHEFEIGEEVIIKSANENYYFADDKDGLQWAFGDDECELTQPPISKDKKYKTRDGRDVRIYAMDGMGDYSIHGAVLVDNGWMDVCWTKEGCSRIHPFDLIEQHETIELDFWVNVYKGGCPYFLYESREIADVLATKNRLACVPFKRTVKVGEGL
jgi:hypothetical protein